MKKRKKKYYSSTYIFYNKYYKRLLNLIKLKSIDTKLF